MEGGRGEGGGEEGGGNKSYIHPSPSLPVPPVMLSVQLGGKGGGDGKRGKGGREEGGRCCIEKKLRYTK